MTLKPFEVPPQEYLLLHTSIKALEFRFSRLSLCVPQLKLYI
nr:MAG TPA: hypothetical protein [Caudoviricetes sp.]